MLRNNKTDVKPATGTVGLKKDIDSVRVSKWSTQTIDHPGSGYNMFDSQHEEVEHTNRPPVKAASLGATKGDEFHWMANAAYNQLK